MLQLIEDLPAHVVGVRAVNAVTEEDYKQVLIPALEALDKSIGRINLIIVLETSVSNYTVGAWANDLKAGFKYFNKWHRIAIVSDQKMVRKFTDAFSFIAPGEYKGFSMAELSIAKQWVAA